MHSLQHSGHRSMLHGSRGVGRNPSRRAAAAAQEFSSRSEEDLLQQVLARIKQTDGGMAMSQQDQSSVNDCLEELERRGQIQDPRPLDNSDIFGDYNVAYTSTQRAPRQSGQPAGGGFRGKLGRRIFKTTKLCQSVLEPDIVVNKVEFLLLGLWRGYVGLRGKLEAQGEGQDTVKVRFQPPHLHLGDDIDLVIGPKSSVVLTTTYLTPEVRIGKGSRGSLFVFTKGGEAATAGMSQVGLARTTASGWFILAGVSSGLAASVAILWRSAILGKLISVIPLLLLLFLAQAMLRSLLSDKSQS